MVLEVIAELEKGILTYPAMGMEATRDVVALIKAAALVERNARYIDQLEHEKQALEQWMKELKET